MDTLVDEKQNHTKGRGTPCESMAIHPSYGSNSKAVPTPEDGFAQRYQVLPHVCRVWLPCRAGRRESWRLSDAAVACCS